MKTVSYKENIDAVIKAIYEVHPYDEVAFNVYQLENI
jgi:hypothetical protein